MQNLTFFSIQQLSNAIDTKELDPIVLARFYLDRIESVGRSLNCYIAVSKEAALAQAGPSSTGAQQRRSLGSLDGVPIALNDSIYVARSSVGFGGIHTAVTEDAKVVRRLCATAAVWSNFGLVLDPSAI